MENFYQILNVEKNSDPKEIKKAYNKLLRKYPPEKEPEMYKKIREAYETLKDDESRKNYDTYFKFGEELKRLEENGRASLEKEDYLLAIKNFKKMLIISKELAYARNLLGVSYLKNKSYFEAKKEFEILCRKYPENSEYILNLGVAFEENGQLKEAENYYKKAFEKDNENISSVSRLVEIYWNNKEFTKASYFLKQCIQADGQVDFNDFQFFFKLLMTYLFQGEHKKVESTLDEIINIVPNDEEVKQYVAWELGRLSYQLFEAKASMLSGKVSLYLEKLAPSNKEFLPLINHGRACEEWETLKEDQYITQGVTMLVAAALDGENEEHFKRIFNFLSKESLFHVKNSLEKLKRAYPHCYKLNTTLHDNLLKVATEEQRNSNYKGNGSNSSSCFVATMCYQDNDAYEVRVFRKWRDQVLKNKFLGKIFIKIYYRFSPKLCSKLENHPKIVSFLRINILDKILKKIEKKL